MSAKKLDMSKADLLALVAEVKKDLTTIAKNEAGKLQKGLPPEEGSASASPEASASASAAPEGSASAEGAAPAPEAGPSAEGAAPAPEGAAPSAGPEGAPPPGVEGGEGAAPAGPSFEELVSLYAALPPEDFEAHAAAIQQAAAMKQGAGAAPGAAGAVPPGPAGAPPAGPSAGPVGPGPSAPPPGPSAGPGPSAPPPGPSAGPSPDEMAFKSEIATLKDELKKSREETAAIGKVVEDFLSIPQRKAVTGITYIPYRKSEEAAKPAAKQFADMTKGEVDAKLKEITKSPKLTKAERDVITGYCLTGANVEALETIINKA